MNFIIQYYKKTQLLTKILFVVTLIPILLIFLLWFSLANDSFVKAQETDAGLTQGLYALLLEIYLFLITVINAAVALYKIVKNKPKGIDRRIHFAVLSTPFILFSAVIVLFLLS